MSVPSHKIQPVQLQTRSINNPYYHVLEKRSKPTFKNSTTNRTLNDKSGNSWALTLKTYSAGNNFEMPYFFITKNNETEQKSDS